MTIEDDLPPFPDASPSPPRARIAIVGAGLGGLYAAWRLQQSGVHGVVLLEARDAPGGRILCVDPAGRPVALGAPGSAAADRFDLGPTWYWPGMQPQLDALVDTLGLQRFPQHEDGEMVVERTPQAPPARVRGYRSEPPSVRLVGGMGALVEALHHRLAPGRVLTGQAVRRLGIASDAVEVHAMDGRGQGTVWRVDHVLCAVPPRLMVDRIDFAPALPAALARRWRATDTWMAPHAKYVAVYPAPFWRAQGLSGEARSARGPMAEVHDASMPGGHAALFGFLGVPARVRQGVAEDVLRAHCRVQLGRLFGPEALTPAAEVIKDWAADPYTATDADLHGSGQHPEPPASGADDGPWHGRLTGIASEWSPQFPGYLAGAVDAAERGVQAWLRSAGTRRDPLPRS
ncbi:flavin monoamine oxidase family protein [Rubrivivax albus]|uniref:Amine oxidase n=1 Tax=Rubrivivax albus TaxID=2499835 RepID=A0A437JUJ3_9BURK|nr:FAD-dependent oxidoreductase [Rubrivivax albus]RVT50914.1 amine oxidase [Rubrivivax albus]